MAEEPDDDLNFDFKLDKNVMIVIVSIIALFAIFSICETIQVVYTGQLPSSHISFRLGSSQTTETVSAHE